MVNGSTYFSISDDDDAPVPGELIHVTYNDPEPYMVDWNKQRECTEGTVAWALTHHTNYDPASGVAQFPVKVGTEKDTSNAHRFFDRNIVNGQLRFNAAAAGEQPRWIEVDGGYNQRYRNSDVNKPLYPSTTAYARGEDSQAQQNQGVIMFDCSSIEYKELLKLDKSGMAALDQHARRLMADVLKPVLRDGKEAELSQCHLLKVSSFGGLTFHVDHEDFERPVHVTLSCLLAQPKKTVYMAEAKQEATWSEIGEWKIFASDKWHRSGTVLRDGAMQFTWFGRVKKVCHTPGRHHQDTHMQACTPPPTAASLHCV